MNKIVFFMTVIMIAFGLSVEFENIFAGIAYWGITVWISLVCYNLFKSKSDEEICKTLGFDKDYLKDAE